MQRLERKTAASMKAVGSIGYIVTPEFIKDVVDKLMDDEGSFIQSHTSDEIGDVQKMISSRGSTSLGYFVNLMCNHHVGIIDSSMVVLSNNI